MAGGGCCSAGSVSSRFSRDCVKKSVGARGESWGKCLLPGFKMGAMSKFRRGGVPVNLKNELGTSCNSVLFKTELNLVISTTL